jgi:hypothetical protein
MWSIHDLQKATKATKATMPMTQTHVGIIPKGLEKQFTFVIIDGSNHSSIYIKHM